MDPAALMRMSSGPMSSLSAPNTSVWAGRGVSRAMPTGVRSSASAAPTEEVGTSCPRATRWVTTASSRSGSPAGRYCADASWRWASTMVRSSAVMRCPTARSPAAT